MHFTWKVYVHLWQYLAQYSLECEIFRTKVVEKIKTHIFYLITFSHKSRRFLYNVEYGPVRWATDDNIIRCTRISCRKTKATDTPGICNTAKNDYVKERQCYVVRLLPVLLRPINILPIGLLPSTYLREYIYRSFKFLPITGSF